MNSLLAAEGRKLKSGAGGLGGGISNKVFSSCLRRASFAAACRLAGESLMPEFGDAEEPFRLVGEAWVEAKQRPLQKGQVRSFGVRYSKVCVSHPHLRYVDDNITVGHVSYPNEALLDDPLTLDLDIGHGRPWSQQEWRGARAAVLLLLLPQAGDLLGSHCNMLMAANGGRSSRELELGNVNLFPSNGAQSVGGTHSPELLSPGGA